MEKWAIVTGASSGIGKDIANELAQRGYCLLLVARNITALKSLAETLSATYRVTAQPIELDLAREEAAATLIQLVAAKGITAEVLVNNAGVGCFGPFVEQEPQRLEKLLLLNVNTLTMLTRHFAGQMVKTGRGYILQVASTAAFLPMTQYALYAATKSFVFSLSFALNAECRGRGVTITTLCPGPTHTNFFEKASHKALPQSFLSLMMKSDEVAKIAVTALFAQKALVIPGFTNKLLAVLSRWAPPSLIVKINDWGMRQI